MDNLRKSTFSFVYGTEMTGAEIIKQVYEACIKYTCLTGKEPTRLYVGRTECENISKLSDNLVFTYIEPGKHKVTMLNMQVFEVNEPSHLFVC